MTSCTHALPLGLMKVSIDRGIYKQVDVERVASGAHYTEDDCWLTLPVQEFIRDQIASRELRDVLDPFAGDGHILRAVAHRYGLTPTGLDIHVAKWERNDSLMRIPARPRTLICTNPPYLAKYSARRKGVLPLVAKYFDGCGYDDLYLLALDRMLACRLPVVAIIPETFITSGLFRHHLERVVVLEKRNPFISTDTPVCVACFDPAHTTSVRCYKDDVLVGTLEEFDAASDIRVGAAAKKRIAFNVVDGELALKAVDGTQVGDSIRFLKGADFAYDTDMIKVSSRLMTRIHVDGLDAPSLETLIDSVNAKLAQVRARTHDMALSPFKGNNKDGVRRRRLDYRLARLLIASALEELDGAGRDGQQAPLF